MTWFYVDDNLADHRKVRRLGKDTLAAMGLWTLCGSWSARTGSDGFIPADVVQRTDTREKMAARLVEVRLWHPAELDGERGYRFHDWSGEKGWQKSAEQRAAEKEARSRAGRIGGQRSAEAKRQARATADAQASASPPATANGTAPAQANAQQNSTPPHPFPSLGSSVRGEGLEPAAREKRPPERCPKHINDLDAPPCGACRDARHAARIWDDDAPKRVRDERLEIRACPFCDADGWRYTPGTRTPASPYARCDHTRTEVVGPDARSAPGVDLTAGGAR